MIAAIKNGKLLKEILGEMLMIGTQIYEQLTTQGLHSVPFTILRLPQLKNWKLQKKSS